MSSYYIFLLAKHVSLCLLHCVSRRNIGSGLYAGQVYKLRTPSARYLASLSSYDASNPTREWGFPELSIEEMNEACESKAALHVSSQQHTSSCLDKPFVNEKVYSCTST